jgi:hypothetical protein
VFSQVIRLPEVNIESKKYCLKLINFMLGMAMFATIVDIL